MTSPGAEGGDGFTYTDRLGQPSEAPGFAPGFAAGYAQAIKDVVEALREFYGPESPPEEYAPKEYIAFIERWFSGREGS